jgi:hypothetical protein
MENFFPPPPPPCLQAQWQEVSRPLTSLLIGEHYSQIILLLYSIGDVTLPTVTLI